MRARLCRFGLAATAVIAALPLLAVPVAAQSDGSPPPSSVSVQRHWGADRYATALAVAEQLVSAAGGRLPRVVIVSGDRWQDAVVAAPLTSANRNEHIAPILLSHPSKGLNADAMKLIERAEVSHAVIVSTDTARGMAVPTSVDAGLRAIGLDVERFSGADASATSVAVADGVADALGSRLASLDGDGGDGTVFVASGESFADALVAGPLVGSTSNPYPLLLTPKEGLDAAVRNWLARLKPARAVLLGGTAAVSSAAEAQITAAGVRSVVRIAGRDRFDTAAKVRAWAAQRFPEGCYGGSDVGLARSDLPFDSFSAGPLLARRCAPLLLTMPDKIPAATAAALDSIRSAQASQAGTPPPAVRMYVFGGEAAVNAAVIDAWRTMTGPGAGDGPEGSDDGDEATATIDAAEQRMASLLNDLRARLGLPALIVSPELTDIARGWSEDMAASGSFTHNPAYSDHYPEGWLAAGENIATVSGSGLTLTDAVAKMFDGLVDSRGHYENMVSTKFTHVGIGIARRGSKFWATQNFATYQKDISADCGPGCTTFSSDFKELDPGGFFMCGILDADASVRCWGLFYDGLYEDPSSGSFAQVAVGNAHVCALRTDATLECWGSDYSVLKNDANSTYLSPPNEAPSGKFKMVSSRGFGSCGLRLDASVHCWGVDLRGEYRSPEGEFKSISVGNVVSCGIRLDDSIDCWGLFDVSDDLLESNYCGGQANCLDQYDQRPFETGRFTKVSAGHFHACGLRTDGNIVCVGMNRWGQTDVPSGTYIDVAAGHEYTCGLRVDGTVACWGDDVTSPPAGTVSSIVASGDPLESVCAQRRDRSHVCWDALG